jgi:hypothetical protein
MQRIAELVGQEAREDVLDAARLAEQTHSA